MSKPAIIEDRACPAGWITRALWQLEAQWAPLISTRTGLCFVVEGCPEVDNGLSEDPHLAGPAAP